MKPLTIEALMDQEVQNLSGGELQVSWGWWEGACVCMGGRCRTCRVSRGRKGEDGGEGGGWWRWVGEVRWGRR